MPGFGELLRSEREARNVPIDRISGETGIHRDYLEALEKDEFQGLPGRSFGKLYIRAYARMLGIDPQPLIDAYDREWQRARPISTKIPDGGSEASRPVGSRVTSWREARIAERRRAAGNTVAPEPDTAEEFDDVLEISAATAADVTTDEDTLAERDDGASEPADVSSRTEPEVAVDDAPVEGPDPIAAAGCDTDRITSARIEEPLEPSAAAALEPIPIPVSIPEPFPTARPLSKRPTLVVFLAIGALAGLLAVAFLSLGRKPAQEPAPPPSVSAGTGSSPSSDLRSSTGGVVPSTARPAEPSPSISAEHPAAGAASPSASKVAAPASPRVAPSLPDTRADGASLSVSESVLGRRIASNRIEGRDGPFAEGTVVWFQTRAVGGASGDVIRHVWMREGRAVQTIRLRLGGPDWRTMSRKTVSHAGAWAVEARDQDDRVLARSDFVCGPSSP